jgi:hypothetical protein
MTPTLGGLITQMCIDIKCTEIATINMLRKCKRYADPRAHLRGNRFVCPSQPTVIEAEKIRVRAGQQKTKRNRA